MKKISMLMLAMVLIAGLGGCAGSRAFQRGDQYAKGGEWDLAVKEYREALKRSPQDIEYRSALLRAEETAANQHYKRARNFLKERKLDQAIIELDAGDPLRGVEGDVLEGLGGDGREDVLVVRSLELIGHAGRAPFRRRL